MFLPGQQAELPAHFMALANETRLRIVQRLAQRGEETVNELATFMRMSQPRISWHLRMLELGGVVRTRRDGRLSFCSLDLETIRRRQSELEKMLDSPLSAVNLRREVSG